MPPTPPSDPTRLDQGDLVAAVDLGSNSFHGVIARYIDGSLVVVDRLKDMVRLAEGLDETGNLSKNVQARAITSLQRMGALIRSIPQERVRVVGTNTLRLVRASDSFFDDAQDALGHPIQVISGYEEARLIFLGVAHDIGKQPNQQRLVADIGGGSTEIVLGSGFDVLLSESHPMGCVSYTQRFFPTQRITPKRFEHAILSAQVELQSSVLGLQTAGWDLAIGASGTNRAIFDVLQLMEPNHAITIQGLNALQKRVVKAGSIDALSLPGLSDRRRPVFAGGLAILIAIFRSLNIDSMIVSDGALREGLLYDLIGRMTQVDTRDSTVNTFAQRYGVDIPHAQRVATVAQQIFQEIKEPWQLAADPTFEKMLRWAAIIHEIGQTISHQHYHKHGSYIVENSDMAGFSRGEQKFLWAMVRSHRRSLKWFRFDGLTEPYPQLAPLLTVALRLAVLFCRSRQPDLIPPFSIAAKVDKKGKHLTITFPENYLRTHPLLHEDLSQEHTILAENQIHLRFR